MKKYVSIIIGIVICVSLFTACDGKSVVFDAKNFVDVQLEGLNTQGKASVEKKYGDVNDFTNEYRDKFKDTLTLNSFLKAIDSIKYEAISKTGELSNGDEIKIKTVYDEKLISEFKIKIENEEFTYTVSGLTEGTMLDPFAEIELVYEKVSPKASVEVFNRSEKQFIRDIRYFAEPSSNLRIGDKIVVTARLSTETATNNGFLVPDVLTKEYTVENIDEYVRDFEDVDKAARDKMLKEAADLIGSACVGGYGSILGPLELIAIPQRKFGEPELTSIYFNILKPGADNEFYNNMYFVYKISGTAPSISDTRFAYAAVRYGNIIKKADGSIEVDFNQNSYSPVYASDKDFDIVYSKVVTAEKAKYEVQEITP